MKDISDAVYTIQRNEEDESYFLYALYTYVFSITPNKRWASVSFIHLTSKIWGENHHAPQTATATNCRFLSSKCRVYRQNYSYDDR